jgi:phosphatidylserine/phosphatidylglycerophosphate/cardiolipin synthase-like enzyme
MHHKFVVLDFDTDDARVYFGSYNFSEPADFDNGENLVLIQDRTVATSYMIEALRIYDHYRFRSAQEDQKTKAKKILELQLPPKKESEKPWWQKDWDDPISKRDRELFSWQEMFDEKLMLGPDCAGAGARLTWQCRSETF